MPCRCSSIRISYVHFLGHGGSESERTPREELGAFRLLRCWVSVCIDRRKPSLAARQDGKGILAHGNHTDTGCSASLSDLHDPLFSL